jgi:hypothetical protein
MCAGTIYQDDLTSNSGHSRRKSRVSYAKKVLLPASQDSRRSRLRECRPAFFAGRVRLTTTELSSRMITGKFGIEVLDTGERKG